MPPHFLSATTVLASAVLLGIAGAAAGATATGPISTSPTVPAKVAPYRPPPTVTVDEGLLPDDATAWREVRAMRSRAPVGSRERADLTWLVRFGELSAVSDSPNGRRVTAARAMRLNAWWYRGHRSPTDRVIVRDPDGVLLTYRRGHGFIVNPVATMGRWRDLNTAWSAPQLADAIAPMLIVRRYAGRNWGALEYYDVPGKPDAVVPGVSAMGQGRAAALFARAWKMTGDPRYATAAELALEGFRVPVDAGGVFNTVSHGGKSGPWYPERAYPGKDHWLGAALNGFMATLIGLRGAAEDLAATPRVTPPAAGTDGVGTTAPTGPDPEALATAAHASALARRLAADGVDTLVKFLPLHDSGAWSYYGLLTPGRPWRTNLADLNYHCYHVYLLKSLERLYPGHGFLRYQLRWQRYVYAQDARCPAR